MLGDFLAPLTANGPWAVLDVGPFSNATMNVFRPLRCRLGVADALEALAAEGQREKPDPTLYRYALREHLPVDPERPWDRVLLWGLLDYLPDAMLAALMERLSPALAAGARLHAMIMSPGRAVPATPLVYALLDLQRADVVGPVESGGTVATARRDMPQRPGALPGLQVEQSRLHVDGRHEVILRPVAH
jgi:hypothetical protein